MMEAHFVTFYSPGTFFAEATEKPISSWNVEIAKQMAAAITERYDARPYGFRFTTRSRNADELDSKVTATSPMHYIGCKVETLEEIKAKDNPSDRILISNMEGNGWDKIVSPKEGWGWSQPLRDSDVVLP